MNRPIIHRLLVVTLLVSCTPAPEKDGSSVRKPNILLISIDTLRADHLGCYGYERDTSPFMDQLAEDGVMYDNAVINTLGTKPSHTSILSSLYQENHRVDFTQATIPEGVLLLQEVLRAEGYTTLGVTEGGKASGKYGFARGFDLFRDGVRSINSGVRRMRRMIAEQAEPDKPIFAFLHTYQVHSPYAPPPKYESLYGTFDSTFVPSSMNLLAVTHSARQDLTAEDLNHIVAKYDAGIRYTDDRLGRFLHRLERMGFLADALVVLTSDHGEEFGEHGGMLHRGLLYEELLRVPLIFAGSRVPEGVDTSRLASSIDIAPTILACAGIAIPPAMRGSPLFCAEGQTGEPNRFVVSQFGGGRYSIRTHRWKYVESTDPPGEELFRLSDDPSEQSNLAATHPDLVRELSDQLAAWKKAQNAVGGEAPPAELSEEEIRRLKALGYLGDG